MIESDYLIEKSAGEIASLLESLPIDERLEHWQEIDSTVRGEILPLMHEQARLSLLEEMTSDEIYDASENMETSDVAELIDILPTDAADQLFDHLDEEDQTKIEYTLKFEEDQVGRLINFDVHRFRKTDTVSKVFDYFKTNPMADQTDRIYITSRQNQFLGSVLLNDLFTKAPSTQLGTIIDESHHGIISCTSPINDLLTIYRAQPFVMKGVIDQDGLLIGRVTLDEMMIQIREESEHQFMGSAGLDEEEDLFAPIIPSAKRRAIWLGINLLTAFLASWVIGFYQETLEKVVALAVLMPIVASMGGITGSQSLTLVIRGLALDQVSSHNLFALLKKEIGVAIINAILWALTVAIITYFWFNDQILSMVIAIALIVNTLMAAAVGVVLPIILKRMNIDPALSGSVILTTVTDVVGFLTFLGLGTLFLLNS
jgi:magnesium transporter